MDDNTEVVLRVWMERLVHGDDHIASLLDGVCRVLAKGVGEPVEIRPAA